MSTSLNWMMIFGKMMIRYHQSEMAGGISIQLEERGGDVSDVKDQIKLDYLSGVPPKKLAEKYGTSMNTIKSWIKRYGWSKMKKQGAPSEAEGAPSEVQGAPRKKRGGQPGNKNAVGHGAPKGNQNAVKHGLFSRYLPEDTRELFFSLDSADPLDLLWDQIKLAYAAIMRAQQIMHVRDQGDKTVEKVGDSKGKIISEKWEVQQAWDKQATFLQAQAKAQKELTTMIKQYEELLHKNWDLATKEQKARIRQLKANTERLRRDGSPEDDEGVEIINDVEKEETDKDIGADNPEVSASV